MGGCVCSQLILPWITTTRLFLSLVYVFCDLHELKMLVFVFVVVVVVSILGFDQHVCLLPPPPPIGFCCMSLVMILLNSLATNPAFFRYCSCVLVCNNICFASSTTT